MFFVLATRNSQNTRRKPQKSHGNPKSTATVWDTSDTPGSTHTVLLFILHTLKPLFASLENKTKLAKCEENSFSMKRGTETARSIVNFFLLSIMRCCVKRNNLFKWLISPVKSRLENKFQGKEFLWTAKRKKANRLGRWRMFWVKNNDRLYQSVGIPRKHCPKVLIDTTSYCERKFRPQCGLFSSFLVSRKAIAGETVSRVRTYVWEFLEKA